MTPDGFLQPVSKWHTRIPTHHAGKRLKSGNAQHGVCVWIVIPEKHLVTPLMQNLQPVASYWGQAAVRIPWKNKVSLFYFKKQQLRQRRYWFTFLLYFSDSSIYLGCGKPIFSIFLIFELKFVSFSSVDIDSISVQRYCMLVLNRYLNLSLK